MKTTMQFSPVEIEIIEAALDDHKSMMFSRHPDNRGDMDYNIALHNLVKRIERIANRIFEDEQKETT